MRRKDLKVGMEVHIAGQGKGIILDPSPWIREISRPDYKLVFTPAKYNRGAGVAVAIVVLGSDDVWVPEVVSPVSITSTWEEYLKFVEQKNKRDQLIDDLLDRLSSFGLKHARRALSELSDNLLHNFSKLVEQAEEGKAIKELLPRIPDGRSIGYFPNSTTPYVLLSKLGDARSWDKTLLGLLRQLQP